MERGDFEVREDCLSLLDGLPILRIDQAVVEIAETYIRHHLMPGDPVGDAMHLALASFYRCNFLATWNCRHLANPNKFDHIRRLNAIEIGCSSLPKKQLGLPNKPMQRTGLRPAVASAWRYVATTECFTFSREPPTIIKEAHFETLYVETERDAGLDCRRYSFVSEVYHPADQSCEPERSRYTTKGRRADVRTLEGVSRRFLRCLGKLIRRTLP
jgi:hypothetical protein